MYKYIFSLSILRILYLLLNLNWEFCPSCFIYLLVAKEKCIFYIRKKANKDYRFTKIGTNNFYCIGVIKLLEDIKWNYIYNKYIFRWVEKEIDITS